MRRQLTLLAIASLFSIPAIAQEEMGTSSDDGDSEYIRAYEECVKSAENKAKGAGEQGFDDVYDRHFHECMTQKGFFQKEDGEEALPEEE